MTTTSLLSKDLTTVEQIELELQKYEEISYIANLYRVPCPIVKRKIREGYSVKQLDNVYDLGYTFSND